MKRRLKTLEQLVKEFEFEYDGCDYTTTFNDMDWCIYYIMLKQLGTEIEVEKMEADFDYTHYDNEIGCYWHELWFEPIFEPSDFIKEDEFKI